MKLKAILHTLLILLVGCTSELPVTPDLEQGQEQGVPVQFTFSITTETENDSRAPIEGKILADNSQVGIYALLQKDDTSFGWDNIQNNFYNACYEAKTVKDFKGNDVYTLNAKDISGTFPTNNKSLKIYAYYPYTEDVTFTKGVNKAATIPIEIKSNINETTDYLYATAEGSSINNPINLQFKHVLSRLNIWVKIDDEDLDMDYYPTLTNIVIKARKPQLGHLDLSTGNIEYVDENTNRTFDSGEINKLISSTYKKEYCSFLFIPKDEKFFSSLILNLKTYTGSSMSFNLTDVLNDVKLEQGKITNLYINLTYDFN